MRAIFPWLRAVVFLVIAVVVFNVVSLVCKSATWSINRSIAGPDWRSFISIKGMKNISTYGIDVAFFGQSASQMSISTMILFKEYGIRAHIFSASGQRVFPAYLTMQEFFRRHSAKIVFYDVSKYLEDNNTIKFYASDFRLVADSLPLSVNKISLAKSLYTSGRTDIGNSYILPIFKHHKAWKHLNKYSLKQHVQADNPGYYYGSSINFRRMVVDEKWRSFRGWVDTGEQLKTPGKSAHQYFIKLIQLCKERNIPLILYKPPMTGDWTPDMHNTVQKVANEMDLPFIDVHMQNVFIESGFDFATDQADSRHPNYFGAEKISRYLGQYLRENFDLPDRRNDPKYAYMYDDLARYKREMFLRNFRRENTMPRWLELLGSTDINNYTVIFSVRDDAQAKVGEEIIGKLRGLGFKAGGVFKEAGQGFIGVWQDGKVVYEAQSKREALEHRGVLPDGMKYYVKSAGGRTGNVSRIIIDGREYSKNRRGFNAIVYDNATGRVMDSVNWDTHVDAGITFKR